MYLSEPMTMVTDYLLATACIVFGIRLFGHAASAGRASVWLWAMGFLVAGASALIGGSFHGFATQLTPAVHKGLWNVTILLIGIACGFMFSGTYVASFSRWSHTARWLYSGLALSSVGFAVQQSDLRFQDLLNHNDIYHLVQLGALYLFFRAAKIMRD